MSTSTDVTTAQFRSRAAGLRVVLKPPYYKFYDGGGRETIPGVIVEFQQGAYDTEDPERAQMLREHAEFGQEFFEVSLPARAPDPGDVLQVITSAAIRLDRDALEQVLQDEHEGFGRQVVLEAAQGALTQVEEAMTALTEQEPDDG